MRQVPRVVLLHCHFFVRSRSIELFNFSGEDHQRAASLVLTARVAPIDRLETTSKSEERLGYWQAILEAAGK
jgi:hypothetical protein